MGSAASSTAAASDESKQALTKLVARANESALPSAGASHSSVREDRKETDGPILVRLAYSSFLAPPSTKKTNAVYEPNAATQDLSQILAKSMHKNEKHNISGVVWFDLSSLAIVHVLEGSIDKVREVFRLIKRDRRHSAVRKLWEVRVNERKYASISLRIRPMLNMEECSLTCEIPTEQGDIKEMVLEGTPLGLEGSTAEDELVRVTYTSRLCARGEIVYRLFQQILSQSMKNNPHHQIGGVLMMCATTSRILQVLEGPDKKVSALYQKISQDIRHDGCMVLSKVKVKTRKFSEWGMQPARLEDFSQIESSLGQAMLDNVDAPLGDSLPMGRLVMRDVGTVL
ncbi:MAG: hypothetical protein SGPRY_010534 [Prymnesium sp.]